MLPHEILKFLDHYIIHFSAFFANLTKFLLHKFHNSILFPYPQVDNLSREWAANADLPQHVVQMVNNFPDTLHPMSQFSAAITAMNSESKFAKAYASGVKKAQYWEVTSSQEKNTCFKGRVSSLEEWVRVCQKFDFHTRCREIN